MHDEPFTGTDENHRTSEDRSGGRCQIKQTRIVLLIWTTMIVMIGVLPLDNFVGHSHWEYIKWIPNAEDLKSPKYLLDIFSDIIGNTVLFFPFGYLLSRLLYNRTPSIQLILAAALGGALSVSIEYYQVYCHYRFPGIVDVICNVSGSLIGARYARFRKALRD
jgi:glycopeptide antibiotics resistance protein